jgi:hypothetical protein
MHPYLPKFEQPKNDEAYLVVRSEGVAIRRKPKPREGQPYTKTIKVVCKTCNETWMSGIEEGVKSVLIPMLQGISVTLGTSDQVNLATWIALKVMVIETQNPNDAVIGKYGRSVFMTKREIPSEMTIWIATHDTERLYMSYWHRSMKATLDNPAPSRRKLKDIQTTTFGVGHLFSFTVVSVLPLGIELQPEPDEAIWRLWPLSAGDIHWPMPHISIETAGVIAESLTQLLRAPFTRWQPLSK